MDAIEAALETMFKRSHKKELPLAWDSVRAEMRIVIAAWCEAEADFRETRFNPGFYAKEVAFLRERAASLRASERQGEETK